MDTNGILVMVGLPACGKSTLAHVLAEQLAVQNFNVKIIELDFLFNQLSGPVEGKWQLARNQALKEANQALLAIKTLVIIDDTNDYRSMRKPYFRLAQMKRVKYLEIHFQSFKYEDSLRRDADRGAFSVGPDTITKIAQRIEWTDCTEKLEWRALFNEEKYDDLFQQIRFGMKVPEPLPVAANITEQAVPLHHVTDLKLRRCFKQLLEAHPELKKHAVQINQIRKEILNNDSLGDDPEQEFIVRVNQEVQI